MENWIGVFFDVDGLHSDRFQLGDIEPEFRRPPAVMKVVNRTGAFAI